MQSKRSYIIFFLFLSPALVFSQKSTNTTNSRPEKRQIDISAFSNWAEVEDSPPPAISNDGSYALYNIKSHFLKDNTIMLHALNGKWDSTLQGATQPTFSEDSRRVIYMKSDTLCLLGLSNGRNERITGVQSFRLFMHEGDQWIAYQKNNTKLGMILRNLVTQAERSFTDITDYSLSENGNTMVLTTEPDTNHDSATSLNWLDLSTFAQKFIWKGRKPSKTIFAPSGDRIVFVAASGSDNKRSVWAYTIGTQKAVECINEETKGMGDNFEIGDIVDFSAEGERILITLRPKPEQAHNSDHSLVPMTIWSYTDIKLQSEQLFSLKLGDRPTFLAVSKISDPQVILLQRENEQYDEINKSGDFILLTSRVGNPAERYWNKDANAITYVVSLLTGEKRHAPITRASFSPDGKYLVGYSSNEVVGADLYVYDIGAGILRNITSRLPIVVDNKSKDSPQSRKSKGIQMIGWMEGNKAILIHDEYDIWEISLDKKNQFINLTSGRKINCRFRLASGTEFEAKYISSEETLFLSSFNNVNKEAGFYKIQLGRTKLPELLFKGSYFFNDFPTTSSQGQYIKARDKEVYLVNRESCQESANLFTTSNFKIFIPLSNIHPELAVIWFHSELLQFISSDKTQTQAILYKPDNFDPSKKYPVILHYYDKISQDLNKFQKPGGDGNGGSLDIAWFVSHDYLVLTPDIHYQIGRPGESALKYIEGAVRNISQRRYVDRQHIGMQGHSFGGYETNYLVTHSKMFAAAVSSSGASDLISGYGSAWSDGSSQEELHEIRIMRMGTTPWQAPNIYVKNSPIFFVGNVTTPILLINNKNDFNVHFEQGLEFFTALRRAGKRAWMLQYDQGGHGVSGPEYVDYIIRMTQFFDHYLKGLPSPKWMTRGIPAASRDWNNGLVLDKELKTPGPGLNIKN